MAQSLVLVAMPLTAWVVASAVGPGIFHDHLDRAGVAHTPSESEHIEEAFASAMLLALTAALLIAIVLALVVTWYFSRRTQHSISRLAQAAAKVGAGDYGSRVPRPGLGGEFDQFADTFNSLAERLEAVESTRRRMLADLAHEMRTPLATLEAHLEALQDGVRQLDEATLRSSRQHRAAAAPGPRHRRGLPGPGGRAGDPPRACRPATTWSRPPPQPARTATATRASP